MIVLSKEQIEEMVDPDQMMDQIEEAYRIYGSGEFYMPPRPTVEHENKQLMYMPVSYTHLTLPTILRV